MAKHFAIQSLDEATAYLAHPLLGLRLAECTQAICDVSEKSAHQILGSPDDAKLRSSLTLFDAVDRGAAFQRALERFFDGEPDPRTIDIVQGWQRGTNQRPSA